MTDFPWQEQLKEHYGTAPIKRIAILTNIIYLETHIIIKRNTDIVTIDSNITKKFGIKRYTLKFSIKDKNATG